MAYVFRGGIYFGGNGKTRDQEIERLAPPAVVRVPLTNIEGKYDRAIVSPGDAVLRGTVIGIPENVHSTVTHSPVSGKVLSLGEMLIPEGIKVPYVEIENDMQYTVSPSVRKCEKKLSECESGEIIEIVHRAGIIDTVSGAAASEKLIRAKGKAEICIVNCVFDDPSLSADHRLTAERPSSVINGLKIILKALGLRRGIIAVGENDQVTVKKLRELLRKDKLVECSVVRSKYPAGGIRELIYAITGTELPEGKTPLDLGCVVFGAVTAVNVFSTFVTGIPYISRVITVGGDGLKRSANVLAPIGTPIRELIAHVGGFADGESVGDINIAEKYTVISGGMMRGFECLSLDHSVTKLTSAIHIVKNKANDKNEDTAACIRCGRCVSACPMRIMPTRIYRLIYAEKYKKAIDEGALLCERCGACSYVCPGKLPLAEKIYSLRSLVKKTNAEKETK